MKKLNTHSIYQLAILVHPLTEVEEVNTKLARVLFRFWRLTRSLASYLEKDSFFSSSLKRAVESLKSAIHSVGIPTEADKLLEMMEAEVIEEIDAYKLTRLKQQAKDFETVLANELPGLSIYAVSPLGIYSTDDLIWHADDHIPEKLRGVIADKAKKDIAESGRCLAFQLPTASAFHMWRALETVMDRYHEALTGKTFPQARVRRTWGDYITALDKAGAEKKITAFLDHIREEYRNPVSHPSVTLEPDDAFSLFGTGLSAIGQACKAIVVLSAATDESPEDPLGLVRLSALTSMAPPPPPFEPANEGGEDQGEVDSVNPEVNETT